MANDFYIKFYFKEWLVSTQGWEADARGWYFNLLCHQADKHRLSSDLETLADLAGVKISQFEKFKECWKRTLKPKFKQDDDGRFYNLKMDKVVKERLENSETQSKRALIGVFMKKLRKKHTFTEDQFSRISEELMTVDFNGLTKTEKYNALTVRFNRTVEAVIHDYNYNYISNIEKGGVGEKTAWEILKEKSPSWAETFEMKNKPQINGQWSAFLTNLDYAVANDNIPFDNIRLIQKRCEKQWANWDKSKSNKTAKKITNER